MKITSIQLAGTRAPGKRMARAFAEITRTRDDRYIQVTILRPGSERKQMVSADCEEDIASMAECLQQELDGFHGGNSEVLEYRRVLERFAN